MIKVIIFLVKIALTLMVLVSYWIYAIAALIIWDVKIMDIPDTSMKMIWCKN
jgi:hypothetical protein